MITSTLGAMAQRSNAAFGAVPFRRVFEYRCGAVTSSRWAQQSALGSAEHSACGAAGAQPRVALGE